MSLCSPPSKPSAMWPNSLIYVKRGPSKYSSIPSTIGTGKLEENFRLFKESLMVINGTEDADVVCRSKK